MNRRTFLLSAPAAAAAAAQGAGATLDWPAGSPRDAGFDPALLEAARAQLARRNTKALLILRRGRKILEWHGEGMTPTTKHYTASMAKALVGGVSLLVAMNDGRLSAQDRASRFISEWRNDPRKSRIAIRHLATHTSGIEDSSLEGVAHTEEPGWKGRFWKREPDPFTISVREAPLLFDPGTGNQYSNPGMAALAWAVTASLRGAPEADIRTLLRDRVLGPIGIPDSAWSIGYGRAYQVDGMDLWANWGGGAFTPRAAARVGEWMMRKGEWDGKALVKPGTVERALKYAGMPLPKRAQESRAPGSGLAWYANFDSVWPMVPRDAFAGAGAGHQVILVVPSLELVIVRNGGELAPRAETPFWNAVYDYLFAPVMEALGNPGKPGPAPYPRSTAIRKVEFAPESSIVRQAVECDNWPMTWADDGAIYTSYGDGSGFEPHVEKKLSQGFSRIDGGPPDFRGVNIRSATGETVGDGPKGGKASGMVMVDGVIYMWVRNLGNSQLWWSADRARTWEKGFTLDRGFGSPAFLNFGRNYAGAIDDFVYTYSQEGPSAYLHDDGVVLARAPRGKLRDRAAWRFHSGAGWSADIAAARPVLRFPGHIQRVDAVHHPATKRCLLVVGYGHNGGWGIYDAPQPWGPWTTVYHTDYWGLGETHGYRIPSKWMSADGRSVWLVFSGLIFNGTSYDAFCAREMKFQF